VLVGELDAFASSTYDNMVSSDSRGIVPRLYAFSPVFSETVAPGVPPSDLESIPSLVPKLCLGTHCPEALLRAQIPGKRRTPSVRRRPAKRSFAAARSQAELGNEAERGGMLARFVLQSRKIRVFLSAPPSASGRGWGEGFLLECLTSLVGGENEADL